MWGWAWERRVRIAVFVALRVLGLRQASLVVLVWGLTVAAFGWGCWMAGRVGVLWLVAVALRLWVVADLRIAGAQMLMAFASCVTAQVRLQGLMQAVLMWFVVEMLRWVVSPQPQAGVSEGSVEKGTIGWKVWCVW